MEKGIETLTELSDEAARFVGSLSPNPSTATLVTLSGELGAGKTAFVKAVAAHLGVEDTVTSPTFVLEKIYILPDGHAFERLVHIDAYRLEKGSEVAALGFDELMRDSGNLVLLEWPEKIADVLPEPSQHLSFILRADGSRTITYG